MILTYMRSTDVRVATGLHRDSTIPSFDDLDLHIDLVETQRNLGEVVPKGNEGSAVLGAMLARMSD